MKASRCEVRSHNGHRIMVTQFGNGSAIVVVDTCIGQMFWSASMNEVFRYALQRWCKYRLAEE